MTDLAAIADMSEPRTEAAKRLLARLSLDIPWFVAGSTTTEKSMVAAIEAEAVATERARIRAAVKGLPTQPGLEINIPGVRHFVERTAVLAAIDGEAT